jgi:hypothetical protein
MTRGTSATIVECSSEEGVERREREAIMASTCPVLQLPA